MPGLLGNLETKACSLGDFEIGNRTLGDVEVETCTFEDLEIQSWSLGDSQVSRTTSEPQTHGDLYTSLTGGNTVAWAPCPAAAGGHLDSWRLGGKGTDTWRIGNRSIDT